MIIAMTSRAIPQTETIAVTDPFLIRAAAGAIGLAIVAAPLGALVVWNRMAYFGEAVAQVRQAASEILPAGYQVKMIGQAEEFGKTQKYMGFAFGLALVLLYEIHDIRRFATVGQFLSYARLVRPEHESAGKKLGFGPRKIGNAHLRWAFAEVVCLFLRGNEQAKKWQARQEKTHGKGKTLAILAAKLARAVYHLLRKQQPFDAARFWSS